MVHHIIRAAIPGLFIIGGEFLFLLSRWDTLNSFDRIMIPSLTLLFLISGFVSYQRVLAEYQNGCSVKQSTSQEAV